MLMICYMSFVWQKPKKKIFCNFCMGMMTFLHFMSHKIYAGCTFNLKESILRSPGYFCPRLHSLLFFTHDDGYPLNRCNISFIFRIFKLLKVLDLRQVHLGDFFPTEIELLVRLRYLAILGVMQSIPSSIANLPNLETFLIEVYYGAVLLPDTIWNMTKLRHLHINGGFFDFSPAEENLNNSSDLNNIDTFFTPMLYVGQQMKRVLRKLSRIRRLKCKVSESKESTEHCHRVVAMEFLSQLESLKLSLYDMKQHHADFCFPSSLKKLTLMSFCWSAIPPIGKLPNLEVLKLLGDHGGEAWETKEGEFTKLQILVLELLDIVRWTGEDDRVSYLQRLVMQNCMQLIQVPHCLRYISTLETIELDWCLDSLASLVREIEEEHMSMGNEDLSLGRTLNTDLLSVNFSSKICL
ncbi:hypothetical protein ACH5RR_016287 [Cinchona calisaya]|uniref:Disease resistance R13L4/SHOC-2-like LRR domain-containing protein n=1 Tax=Cinchona calisaya TaxID=153742 RepID=A0ABD2ZVX8_9GENT